MLTLPNEAGKINFIVSVYEKQEDTITGGIIVLHKLAYEIAKRGHNVYVFTEPDYPHENIRVIPSRLIEISGFVKWFEWDAFSFSYDNTVSIHCQIDRKNPMNTQYVVRWILYDTEFDIESTFGQTDIYFNTCNFKTYRHQPIRPLVATDYHFDKLYVTNTGKRKGFCHMLHKHTPPEKDLLINKISSFDLTDWKKAGGYDYLREKLNEYEYMLTYDQRTFYTAAAGLCGCKSIILNPGPSYEFAKNAYSESLEYKEHLTPEKYREIDPIQKYGVAYGLDDIHWANSTIHMVTDHLRQLEKINDSTIDSFVEYWENKIFGK